MKTKEDYILDINNRFMGDSKELLIKQLELFYKKDVIIEKNKYKISEKVKLKKGTFIHGIPGEINDFDFIIKNKGFISSDFTFKSKQNKICNSVGMWNIKEDCYLRDYINTYSGFTITYCTQESSFISKLIPYHKFDEVTEKINNDEGVWNYWGEQTKEVRFLPSLVSNKRQIAFILNMESSYAKAIAKSDVWILDKDVVKSFINNEYYLRFLEERKNRNATTTDRECAIVFGVPAILIEGVLVGRKLECDKEKLDYIKSKLPDCYICNLDGKVIISNE